MTTEERERLRQLERENRELRRANDILKSASVSSTGERNACRHQRHWLEDRAVPGHWEGDLLAGSKNTHIATLVERRSRYVMLARVEGKDTESVVSAITDAIIKLPQDLRRTLMWDRGLELAAHKAFTVSTDVKVYFCDPRSPWQRGTNENTNGLLRQYLPHHTDLSQHTQRDLDAIARKLNMRPRKTLGFDTPAVRLGATIASTE